MNEYLIVFSQWRVIICIQCQQNVKTKNVVDHFKKTHHKLFKNQTKSIEQQFALTDVIQDFRIFEFIFALNEFISKLKIHHEIFVCVVDFACFYTTVSFFNMKSHCVIHHKKHRKRFSMKKNSSSWISMRRYQEMFTNDHDNNYFRVNFISSSINQIVDDAISMNANNEIKQLFRVVRDALNFRIFRQMKNRQKKIEFASWIEKIRWIEYLKKFDRQKLMNLMKFSIVEKKSLTIIVWEIVKKILQQFQQTMKHAKYFLCMKIVRNEFQQIKY
jgi:hypothetical protein